MPCERERVRSRVFDIDILVPWAAAGASYGRRAR